MFNLKANLAALRVMAEMLTAGFCLTCGALAALHVFNVI